MSRSYAPTELKRRLKPALEELEQLGFLEPLSPEERYSYVKRGTWRIILIRGHAAQAEPAPAQEASELIEALKARGVTARTAAELVESHPSARVLTKIEVFDWLSKNEDKRVGKNPAGYLVASIRGDYQAPGDFPPAEAVAAAQAQARVAEQAAEDARRRGRQKAERDASDRAREVELRSAWERLPEADREEILAAVKAQNPGLSRWRKMLEPLCLAALEDRLRGARQTTLFPDGDGMD
jgi:hypothetical protein